MPPLRRPAGRLDGAHVLGDPFPGGVAGGVDRGPVLLRPVQALLDRPALVDAVVALELTAQLFALAVVAALWFTPRPYRRAIVPVALVAVLLRGLGATAWAHHEADRAWAGHSIRPAAALPFRFVARPVRMVPYGAATLPAGIPAHALQLHWTPYRTVIYDPASHQTLWVGRQIAAPAWGRQREPRLVDGGNAMTTTSTTALLSRRHGRPGVPARFGPPDDGRLTGAGRGRRRPVGAS